MDGADKPRHVCIVEAIVNRPEGVVLILLKIYRVIYLLANIESKSIVQPKYLFILFTLFASTWLASNIAAIKLVHFWGITLTGGFLIFPFTCMFNNLIIEVYGYKNSRQVLWSGFLFNIVFIFSMNLVNMIPASPSWPLQNEFQDILIPSTRIVFASLLSFFFSDFISCYSMAKLKLKDRGRSLLKRIILSSSLATVVDITLFFILAFFGVMPIELLVKTYFLAFIKRIFFQILMLPILWFLIDLIKRREGFEVYDHNTDLNPFLLDNVYDINNYKIQESSPLQNLHN